MENEITESGPALPAQTANPAGFNHNLSPDDFQIPRVELLQAMSPKVAEGSGTPGTLVNSISNDLLGDGKKVNITIIKVEKNFIKWLDRSAGGGIEYRTKDPNDPRVIEDIKWNGMEKPKCTQYLNFLCLVEGGPMPMVLPCAMTNYKAGKDLLTMAFFSGGNCFDFTYEVSAKTKSNKFGTFFVFGVRKVGPSTMETRAAAQTFSNMFAQRDISCGEGEVQQHTSSNFSGEEF